MLKKSNKFFHFITGTIQQFFIALLDNDPVRNVAVAMIEDMDYIVLDAPNGDKALEIIKQRDDIDLLLSDVVMPGMMISSALSPLGASRTI